MRIAYLLGRFPVLSETFVAGELLQVERQGAEVQVFSIDRGDASAEVLVEAFTGRRSVLADQTRAEVLWGILRFGLRHPARLLCGVLRSLAEGGPSEARAFLRLLPWAADPWLASCDRLHAHFATLPTRAAHLLSRATGVPFGFTAHALDIFPAGPDLPRRVRDASWIVTVCEYNRRELARQLGELPEDRVHVIPCGVDADHFRRRHAFEARSLRIVAVGRLVPKKGFGDLVAAVDLLVRRGLEPELRFVGEGPAREALEAMVAKQGLEGRVSFLGARPHAEIQGEIEAATVLVQPSVIASDGDRDSMPVVLKEAMSLETPVVGTNVAGLPEAIGEDAGWVVPPHDPEALAERLAEIAEMDPEHLAAVGRRGRVRVLERFRLDELSGRLLAVLERSGRG